MNKSIQARLRDGANRQGPLPSKQALQYFPSIAGKRCWEWLSAPVRKGRRSYAKIWYRRKYWQVHRLAWFLKHGPLQETLDVCHKCDNPTCVRPSHLFIATTKANVHDCIRKGRFSRGKKHSLALVGNRPYCKGETNSSAKFKDSDIPSIRRMYASKRYTYQELADMYGVTKQAVYQIVKRKTYSHVR